MGAEAGNRRWEERRRPREDSSRAAELRDSKLLSRKGDGGGLSRDRGAG